MALPGTWRSDNAQVFVGSFRQPYEALAANDLSPMGGTRQQLLPTLTGPANFATRYYDTGVDPRSFPQLGAQAAMQPTQQTLQQSTPQQVALGAQRGGYENAEGNMASWSSTTARTVERQAKKKRKGPQGPPLSDYVRYFRDHMSRFFLWWGALFVMIFAVITAFVAMEAVLSEEFQTFSHLAWVSWFPSFSAMLLVLFVLSACALAAGVLALWVGYKESRPALRAFFVASATLGVLMLFMALFTWLYTARARPFVVSAANLLCQDLHPFHCADVSTSLPPQEPAPASTAAPPQAPPTTIPPLPEPLPSGPSVAATRRLGSGGAGATAAVAAASFLGELHASTGSRAPAPSRRLDPSKPALKYSSAFDHQKDLSGSSELCRMLQKLCVPPADFNAETSCVCSGVWRHQEHVQRKEQEEAARRRLQASEALELRGFARRLEEEDYVAPVPWLGTAGAYCRAWAPEDTEGDWCFVASAESCPQAPNYHFVSQAGVPMTRSGGPCGDEVDSRSQYVLDGLDTMAWPLELSAALGLLLLTMSCCGVLLYRMPSTQTVWTKVGKQVEDQDEGLELAKPQVPQQEELTLEKRFDIAQRDAMRTINDATSDDMKFMLYGFYKQAKEGNVTGSRPGFFNHRERCKWDSWAQHRGMGPEEAIEGYIQSVELLKSGRVS
mmetsp:Transcript_90211/g.263827  ORF Transcript_90211/g.263827 Transcript_90211/m.263827 type:complete len:669 (-) Transcript_90211:71-2077(-)